MRPYTDDEITALLFMVIIGIVCALIAGIVGWLESRMQNPTVGWAGKGYGKRFSK